MLRPIQRNRQRGPVISIREPLIRNPRRGQVAEVVTLPAPIGGWNARDPLPQMKPHDAVTLDNIIPGTGAASLRRGYTVARTGLTDPIETLMEYAPPSGVNEFYAATETKIWDITTATPAEDVTSLTNGRWQHTMFATSAGNFLVCCNGADDVRNYNGAAWSTPTITGVTSADLINVSVHAQRLWFTEKDTLDAWYLGISSISGAANKLALGPYCRLGGYLLATGSWTRDGGSGPEDLFVAVTSKGQVVIYTGSDPTDASDFRQVGVFRIPEPIGRRCLIQAGSELGVLTSAGLVPLSQVMVQSESAQSRTAITDKISGQFNLAFKLYGSSFGWQAIEYPREKLLLINVPVTEGVTQHQYVMNTDTGAWCRFTDLNVNCWSLFGSDLYAGTNDGEVIIYGPDHQDDGQTISAVIRQAFSSFGTPQYKRFMQVRPRIAAPTGYAPGVEMKVDYDISAITAPATAAADIGAEWDVAEWDLADWAEGAVSSANWHGVTGMGLVGAPALTLTLDNQFSLYSIDVMFEAGGHL